MFLTAPVSLAAAAFPGFDKQFEGSVAVRLGCFGMEPAKALEEW